MEGGFEIWYNYRMRKFSIRLLLILLLFYPDFAFSQGAGLKPSGFINDYTNTLAEQEKASLESLVAGIEKETSAEIGVAVIQSLEGRSIEDYANEIFNNWGIGKKGKDNGVLILVSLNDRKMRIETGYGLEPVLPDAVCGRIIRNVMAPSFRENNYYKGISDAVTTIGQYIKGERPATAASVPDTGKFLLFFLLWNGFLVFFAFMIFHTAGVIIYLAVVVPLGITVLFSGKQAEPSAAMGLLMLLPFFLVFSMAMLAPVIFTIIRWRLKKKYKRDWKEYIPVYIDRAMSRSGSLRGGRSGGSFGGGHSGGGGASGSW